MEREIHFLKMFSDLPTTYERMVYLVPFSFYRGRVYIRNHIINHISSPVTVEDILLKLLYSAEANILSQLRTSIRSVAVQEAEWVGDAEDA